MKKRSYFLLIFLMVSTTVFAVPSMQLTMDAKSRILKQRQEERKFLKYPIVEKHKNNQREYYLQLKADKLSRSQVVSQKAVLKPNELSSLDKNNNSHKY